MKTKTTKLFLSIFAFAALAITACSGGGNSDASSNSGSSSSSSSSTEPEPGPEPGPEPEEGTQYTGEVEYGTFAGKVYAYAFDSLGDYVAVEAEIAEDTQATFVLPEDSDYEGLVMVELNPDAEDFDGSDWSEVAKKSLDLDIIDLDPESFSFELRNCVEAGDPDTDLQVWGTNGHAGGTEWGKVGEIDSETYKVSIQLYVGSKISFHIEGEKWLGYDNFANTNSKLKFARASTESNDAVSQVRELIEFTINTANDTISIGGEVPVAATYNLVGGHNEWGNTDYGKKLHADANDVNHYTSDKIYFEASTPIKVNDGTNWFANASVGNGYTIDAEGNVVITDAGNYYINFYVNSESGNHITLDREYNYTVQVGSGEAKALIKNTTAKLYPGQTGEYMLQTPLTSVAANAAIVFAGSSSIAGHIGLDGNDTTPEDPKYNNAVAVPETSPTEFKIRNDASPTEGVQIYLKTWEDGGYSFFVTGGAPLTLGYNLFLDGVDAGEVSSVEKGDGMLAQYKVTGANLEVGQVLTLSKDAEAVDADHFAQDDGPNNNITSELKVNISGTADIYLKVWAGSGDHSSETYYTVWAGTPEVNLETIKLKKNTDDPITPTSETEVGDNLKVYKLNLTKDDVVTFTHSAALKPFGFYHYTDHAVFEGTEFTAPVTGTYTFYLNSEYKIYHDGPVATAYKLVGLGGDWSYASGLVLNPDEEGMDKTTTLHQWSTGDQSFTANQTFKLFNNDTGWIGYSNLENTGLYRVDGDGNIQFKYSGTYKVYLKLLTNNTYQIYIYHDAEAPTGETTFTWTDNPNINVWANNRNVYAWLFGSTSSLPDKWVSVTVLGDRKVSVNMGDYEGIVLANFNEGVVPSGTAGWSSKVNQTGNGSKTVTELSWS